MKYAVVKTLAILKYGGISRHPLIRDIDPFIQDNVATRFIHSQKYGFTYLRVPKNANSTIAKTLAGHMPEMPDPATDSSGRKSKSALRCLPSPEEFAASFSFTFVRDPASRVLSAYRDKAFYPRFQ